MFTLWTRPAFASAFLAFIPPAPPGGAAEHTSPGTPSGARTDEPLTRRARPGRMRAEVTVLRWPIACPGAAAPVADGRHAPTSGARMRSLLFCLLSLADLSLTCWLLGSTSGQAFEV